MEWTLVVLCNCSYLMLVTNPLLANQIDASLQGQDRVVVSWGNKLPKIVPRFRLSFIKISQRDRQNLVVIPTSFSKSFNRTKGGLIQSNHKRPRPLQFVANAAFLTILYGHYLTFHLSVNGIADLIFIPKKY